MAAKIAAAVLVLALAVPAGAGQSPRGGLCPEGFSEGKNINGVGCSFCLAEGTDCQPSCVSGPGGLFCPEPDGECCQQDPCNAGCPEPKPARCSIGGFCSCTPESCCFTVCPELRAAPATSQTGLVALAVALLAFGVGGVRVAARRRR